MARITDESIKLNQPKLCKDPNIYYFIYSWMNFIDLTYAQRNIFAYIYSYLKNHNEFYVSNMTISQITNIHPDQVSRELKALVNKELIIKDKNDDDKTTYSINYSKVQSLIDSVQKIN